MAALAVILALLAASPVLAENPTNIQIQARDGFPLKAVLKKPTAQQHTVVMLHGWQSVKEEWEPLMKQLDAIGWGYLAYDSRSSGPRELMIDDLGMVVRVLEKEHQVPRSGLVLAGASLGANVVLNYAALTGFTGPLICLSPGIDYQGLRVDGSAVNKLTNPILVVASTSDRYAYETGRFLVKKNPPITFWSDVKRGHGVQVFDEAFLARLIKWLQAH